MPIQINRLPVTTDRISALNNAEKFIAACHVYLRYLRACWKKRINFHLFNPFSRWIFYWIFNLFFYSELSGTIFAWLGVMWTVLFFKNFQIPYFRPGPTEITGQFPDW
jgi:hypothetical protein